MDQEPISPTYLIIVYGLPASGKTTFSKYIHEQLPNSLLISSDTVQLQLSTHKSIPQNLQNLPPKQLLSYFQSLSSSSPSTSQSKAKFDQETWKQSRILVEEVVDKLIPFSSIIVEDDLLLRSQRRVFRRISWRRAIRYVQLFMDSGVVECIGNLGTRKEQQGDCVVTEEVITKAALKLQKEQDEHCIKLSLKDRNNININTIVSFSKIIKITPNDPNNPTDPNHKPPPSHPNPHQHTPTQQTQLQARQYIHCLLQLSPQEIQTKFGAQLVKSKKLNEKKVLAGVLANWKKELVKLVRKKGTGVEVEGNFGEFLKL